MADLENALVSLWGDQAYSVIKCARAEKTKMSFDKFLKECVACGGDWGAMLLTGIKHYFPQTWRAIPNDMGKNPFAGLCYTLELLGVEV